MFFSTDTKTAHGFGTPAGEGAEHIGAAAHLGHVRGVGVFLPSDPELALYGEDLRWPFAFTDDGDLEVVSGPGCLEQGLILAVLPLPGEIETAPSIGVDWAEYENGPAAIESSAVLAARVLEAQRRDDRLASIRVEILENGADLIMRSRGVSKASAGVGVDVPLGGS